MSAPSVPDEFVPAFVKLQEVSEDDFRAVLQATEVLRSHSGMADFAALASESVGIDHGVATSLLGALMSLVGYAEDSNLDLDELIEVIPAAEELGLDPSEQELLASRIKTLVNHSPMRLLSKSVKMALQHERLFLDSQITTDLRPIFDDEITEGLAAAVLTHTLRIDFIRAGIPESLHVALDQNDLLNMRQTIDRALAKSSSLRDTLESAGISNLTIQE